MKYRDKLFKLMCFIMLLFVISINAQPYASDVTFEQLTDGSGLVRICYRAHSMTDSLISTNVLGESRALDIWQIPVVTLLDTISEYSSTANLGWSVSASDTGDIHCILWDMTTDMGTIERCGFQGKIAVFDSVLSSYSVRDSFLANDTLRPDERAFGLAYKHGELWVMFHDTPSDYVWVKPYSLPDMIPGDSIFIGTVAVGPSDMAFAGDRLLWAEDTRVILKEFNFDTGESHAVRSDWWDLPGTDVHLSGVAFDGENLWVAFSAGTFVALDTSDFSLVDTMYFPAFGVSTPATSADGLAYGLGILWCFSNDNKVYAIDIDTKSIIHEIPTGDVVEATGAEGCAWDGINLWVVDYARFHVYQLSLFEQITFYYSNFFCLDNKEPLISWLEPSEPDFTDTLIARAPYELEWFASDSHLTGGHTEIMCWDDTISMSSADIFSSLWMAYDWAGFDAVFDLHVTDSFGNHSYARSPRFFIDEDNEPYFVDCPPDIALRIDDTISVSFYCNDLDDDSLSLTFSGFEDYLLSDSSLTLIASGAIGDVYSCELVVCDEYFCDTCLFEYSIVPDMPPEFVICPGDTFIRTGQLLECDILCFEPEGDIVSYTFDAFGEVEFIGDTLIRWLTDGADYEMFPITIIAEDPAGNIDSCSFLITIEPNEIPQFINCPEDTVYIDTALATELFFDAFDEEGDSLAYSIVSSSDSWILNDSTLVYVPYDDTTGFVDVIVCDYEGCDTCSIIIRNTFAIEETPSIPSELAIMVYPNPFNSCINISTPDGFISSIYDLHGQKVIDIPGNNYNWYPSSNIDSGVYIVRTCLNSIMCEKRIVYIK